MSGKLHTLGSVFDDPAGAHAWLEQRSAEIAAKDGETPAVMVVLLAKDHIVYGAFGNLTKNDAAYVGGYILKTAYEDGGS